MLRVLVTVLACALVSLGVHGSLSMAAEKNRSTRAPWGIDKRVPWTTSRVVSSPDPPAPYRLEVAFPRIKFNEPLNYSTTPGTNRLFIAQRDGKIFSFPNDPQAAQADLMLDVGRMTYGFALHPDFLKNGYFFVASILDPKKEQPDGTLVTRYQVTSWNPPQARKETEQIFLRWPSGGHNGGCLRFGPEGFLYISTGDSSGIADEYQTGQTINDLVGSILRIDVDHPSKDLPYTIPADNPFANRSDARGEVWAFGLRQAWKFSFDRATNRLWAGEIGQDLWESIHIIRKGGNYGWSLVEGRHPFHPERKKGPGEIIRSIVEHPHSDFRSITGGFIYHGKRLPELTGAYIYADYDTGKVWMLRYDDSRPEEKRVTENRELCDTNLRLIEFGEDATGELFLLDHIGGQLHKLMPTPKSAEHMVEFPRRLSATGLFASTRDNKPMAGVIPYSVNSPLWSDNAIKERFLAIPGDGKIEYNGIPYPQPAPGAPRGWRFPDGTVAVKTFSLELEPGNPSSLRRLETRILHLQQTPGTAEVGDQVWRGYTYIWNEEQTDAELLDSHGKDQAFTIKDPKTPGGTRQQVWHFPSRAECTMCHTMPAKYVLGLNTLQLNKDHDYGGVVANQLATFDHLGLFTAPLPAAPEKLPHLTNDADPHADLNARARSYLHSNCSHCHMKWGGGNAQFQLLATQDLKEMGIAGVRPNHGTFGLTDPAVLVPGHPEQSVLLQRMQILGLGRMPHIASNLRDDRAIELIREWITKLPTINSGEGVDIGPEGIPASP